MDTRTICAFGAGVIATASVAFLVATGPDHDQADKVTQQEVDAMAEMSPDDMMAKMMELSTPNEHHAEFQKMVGEWDAAASFIMDPAAPPTTGNGTMVIESVLGGRYFRSNFSMHFMGQPFEGIGYAGYSNAHGKYISTWMDTMSTKIIYMEGNKDEDGNTVMKGMSTTPMGDNPMKIVTKHPDENTFVDMFYDKMPDGTWFNSGTITYTRK
jgi:hypothetical protein